VWKLLALLRSSLSIAFIIGLLFIHALKFKLKTSFLFFGLFDFGTMSSKSGFFLLSFTLSSLGPFLFLGFLYFSLLYLFFERT
jgi:hypothetical protein